ncbi:MAG: hypothetical protein ACU0AT_13905 [Tranquillimonas sp.]
MDKISEIIAHFIGTFHLSLEGARLRADYEKFRLAQKADRPLSDDEIGPVRKLPDYRLEDFDPRLSYRPDALPPEQVTLDSTQIPWIFADLFGYGFFGAEIAGRDAGRGDEIAEPNVVLTIEPPGSVVLVTIQIAELQDADTFGMTLDPVWAQQQADTLDALHSLAQSMIVLDLSPLDHGSWSELAEAAIAQIAQVAARVDAGPVGAVQHVFQGEAALSIRIDGAEGAELPVASDSLPAFFADRLPEGAGPDGGADDGVAGDDSSAGGCDQAPAVEAAVETAEVAADEGPACPAPAVMHSPDGQIISGSAVSDRAGFGAETGRDDAAAARADGLRAREDAGASPPRDGHLQGSGDDGGGGSRIVTGANVATNEVAVSANWLDAKVIAVNGGATRIDAISQVNVLSDRDEVPEGILGSAPSTLINAAEIHRESSGSGPAAELSVPAPANWVMARIDADLISTTWTKQLTFATDTDAIRFSYSGGSTDLVAGWNEIGNLALYNEIGFRFDLLLVGGEMIDISAVTQTNVLLDDDVVTGAFGASTGDNLLFNGAKIESVGIDSYRPLTGPFKQALDDVAAGRSEAAGALASDPLFAGLDMLRVLFIAGDFVKVNLVEQVNVIGDSDQVALALGDFDIDLTQPDAVEVVTGSNVLANLASVGTVGTDSTVLSGKPAYSDAVIHQAGLTDPDALPDGVKLAGLANEAVAFLTDGMIDMPAMPDIPDFQMPDVFPANAGAPADVMQTVLS